jgi:ligand-binding sensor protein
LIDLETWKRIQDNFSTVTNIHITTLDAKGLPLTSPSGESRLCKEIIRYSPFKNEICNLCLPTFLGGKGVVDKNLSFTCVAGLRNFIVPLQVNSFVIGYILVGPLNLVRLKNKEEYARQAEELHIDLDEFWHAIGEIKTISFHVAQALSALIKDVGEYILNLSYQNFLRKKEAAMPDSPKLNRLLATLLDSVFQISKADIGSIMLLDKDKSELRILTAKGLSDEIIKNTRIKLGEGISGIAAQEGKAFIIDDATENNRIKRYMERPQINSSLIIPIKREADVLGIMNLCTLKASSVQLDINSIPLINNLINLAVLALRE